MRQITMRQLVRQAKDIQSWLPFELVRDGEVIAVVLPHDVRQGDDTVTQGKYDDSQASNHMFVKGKHGRRKQTDEFSDGLRFSKSKQAAGRMR